MVKVTIVQPKIDENHQDSIWYGGTIAVAEEGDYIVTLVADGDVRAFLIDKDDEDNIIEKVVDKNCAGEFYNVMGRYFKSDREVYKAEGDGLLVFNNNNWFEVFVENTKTQECDSFVAEGNYDEIIKDIKDNFNSYAEWIDGVGEQQA